MSLQHEPQLPPEEISKAAAEFFSSIISVMLLSADSTYSQNPVGRTLEVGRLAIKLAATLIRNEQDSSHGRDAFMAIEQTVAQTFGPVIEKYRTAA